MTSKLIKIIILVAGFCQTSDALGVPTDFYNPIGMKTAASHLKCVGGFYGHYDQEPYSDNALFLAPDNPLILPFDDNGNVMFGIDGNILSLGLGASQAKGFNGDVNILDIYLTVRVKDTNMIFSEIVDLYEKQESASIKLDGDDHLNIECYPVLLN